ncbi:MAG: hypothetical protein NZO58_09340 [Gemmataceae bacterium]|nr:hypothetical protein [Gemmataceae bacterium]
MMRRLLVTVLGSMCFVAVSAAALAQTKEVAIAQKYKGSVEDESAPKPEVITNSKSLEMVWKAWKAAGDVPKVDFTKNLIVVAYSPGSILDISRVTLDEGGNLTVLAFGSRDLRPGFRYVLGVVARQGVKSVNKKPLPAD